MKWKGIHFGGTRHGLGTRDTARIGYRGCFKEREKNFWEVRRYLANFRYVVCTLPRSPTCLHTALHLRSPGRPGLPSTETRERPSLLLYGAPCPGAGLQSLGTVDDMFLW